VDDSILIRYGEPGKYDHAPYGHICKVVKMMLDKDDVYIQLSNDEKNPSWTFVGSFEASLDNKEIRKYVSDMLSK